MVEHICAEISLENVFGFTTVLLPTDSIRRPTVSSQQISELASMMMVQLFDGNSAS